MPEAAKLRCGWVGADPLYVAYHDEEWGVPLRDDRVRENPAYLSVVLLARVVTRLGTIDDIHAGIIENMFASDVAFLQDLYRRVNQEGHTRAGVTCPACEHTFAVDVAGSNNVGTEPIDESGAFPGIPLIPDSELDVYGFLVVAIAARDAAHFMGMPEGNTALAQTAIYLATAPKSTAAYKALGAATRAAKETRSLIPPMHILNAPTWLIERLGYARCLSFEKRRQSGHGQSSWTGSGSSRKRWFRMLIRPPGTHSWPFRATRAGRTESNRSTPR